MRNKIEILRKFIRISKTAFDFAQALSGNGVSDMHYLHNLAFEELEKETPDLDKVDSLLQQMEELATPKPMPNFEQ